MITLLAGDDTNQDQLHSHLDESQFQDLNQRTDSTETNDTTDSMAMVTSAFVNTD